MAFSPTAVEAGAVGVMVQGWRWSVFSNGAGTGSAAIANDYMNRLYSNTISLFLK